jgi:valyl-tRNA synthetase
MELQKHYDPKQFEKNIYSLWENSGFFNPDKLPPKNKTPFSIVLPPPNVTGTLHIGHALTVTIEDIIVRYQRMLGKKTLWLPGTDHASIATETKFLRESNISKQEFEGKRDEFIKLVNDFALKNQKIILEQLKAMGCSLDWSRLCFTLDEKRSFAVRTAFKKLWDEGLISRKERVVNWDPKGKTCVSDDEIEYETRKTVLYTFRYSKDFPIPISTTRPETKVGDVAVAVHPQGKWKKYIGKKYVIENFAGVKLEIQIIGDKSVDENFGTGAVGVTPSHSKTDEELADKHGLQNRPKIINEEGFMTESAGILSGLKVGEAKEKIVTWIKEKGLMEKEEIIDHNIALAQRSKGIIEPLPKPYQCFILVNKPIKSKGGKTLKELMKEVVEKGKIKIIPKRFEKIYFHWINNLKDWNISRQVWYGHRIPIWYCESEKCYKTRYDNPIVSVNAPKKCPRCGSENLSQEVDTLDTWFSSALWTFSTLGWPKKTKDLKIYHPTDILETGYDILFFWVARMILMSTFLLNQIPFKTVYLHGLVRDEKGRKMSKSLGNVIDPLLMIERYGTDALRFSLILGTAPGKDATMSEDKIRGMKNFANKIWNASRFVLMNTQDFKNNPKPKLNKNQKQIIKEFKKFCTEITSLMNDFKFYLAAEKIYHYFWHNFCDKIIEEQKKYIKEGNNQEKRASQYLLLFLLENQLKILHPFMPFVTESIYQIMFGGKNKLLMIEKWPK